MVPDNNARSFLASGETGCEPKTARAECHAAQAATLSFQRKIFIRIFFKNGKMPVHPAIERVI
jgi:hypothetical protein